ncbi:glycosyltransferase family 4 protein [Nocardia sp. alder85J]|uniref:glycosyltransferase family 4 protein n=1 Tax=Nocardia sp. alder85J TaxID=2862949 RepID=UPI001CD6F9FA|nr:glycosyltransferase family 4 protein [Nocardia sp. alder85J]MCX4093213.1 glycosyltransferase family 4 protein [Nocardia sp. alder85J]
MTGSEWFAAVPGGLNRYFTDLYGALAGRADVEVTAAAFGPAPAGGRSWGPVGGTTLHRARTALLDRRDLGRNTVLDRHFCLYGPVGGGRLGNQPTVVHFHGPWAAESRMSGEGPRAVRAKYLLERVRYARADRFVVLSRYFHDVLVDDYRIPPDRIAIIPPGVDLPATPGPAASPADAPPMVLCVRRLERRMGIDVLIDSWPTVLDKHPEARLVIVGTGTIAAELRERAAGLPSIEFTGFVDDDRLDALYAEATLTVVPTLALEGFGLVTLAALAAGRAPVVTDCGGLPDAVRGLDDSLIVPAGDREALAARLVAALDGDRPDPAHCRAHAATFSWTAAADRHLALYRDLVGV